MPIGGNVFIKADTENTVLTKIEAVGDAAVRNALLSLFWWRVAQDAALGRNDKSSEKSS